MLWCLYPLASQVLWALDGPWNMDWTSQDRCSTSDSPKYDKPVEWTQARVLVKGKLETPVQFLSPEGQEWGHQWGIAPRQDLRWSDQKMGRRIWDSRYSFLLAHGLRESYDGLKAEGWGGFVETGNFMECPRSSWVKVCAGLLRVPRAPLFAGMEHPSQQSSPHPANDLKGCRLDTF